MVIETREYRLDKAVFMRTAYRVYLGWYFKSIIASFIVALSLVALNLPAVGAIEFLLTALMPFAMAHIKCSRALALPINAIPFVSRFDESSIEQLSRGERRSFIAYSELASVKDMPEGLCIWLGKKGPWILIQRDAFKSPMEYQSACDHLIRAGLMKPKGS